MSEPDVRLEIKVKNNLILKRMEAAGYKSVGALVKAMRADGIPITPGSMYELVAMKALPEGRRSGAWYPHVERLAMFLKCSPEDLFSAKQRSTKLDDNRAVAEMHYATFEQIAVSTPEQLLLSDEMQSLLDKAIRSLPPRLEQIVRLRYGIGVEQQTGDQIAKALNVGHERVFQLERKALQLLKHPMRGAKELKMHMEDL